MTTAHGSSRFGRRKSATAAVPHEEDTSVDAFVSNMSDTIFIAYTDSTWDHEVETLQEKCRGSSSAKSLSKHVSYLLPVSSFSEEEEQEETPPMYDKIVVIKENDPANLAKRISELLRHEDCKRVNFGVFGDVPREDVVESFVKCAKESTKRCRRSKALGRIWSVEVNGSGRGCGIIGADDKIHVWWDR